MIIRSALDSDHPSITQLAQDSGLLIDESDADKFKKILHWLYAEHPTGQRLQIVGEDDKKIVAHYGAMPIIYKFGGQTLLAGLASNLVIDSAYRKNTPFIKLQSYIAKEYSKIGYDFLYGVISRPGVLEPHLRMGWKKMGELKIYVHPIKMYSIFSKLIKNKLLKSICFLPLGLCEILYRITEGINSNVIDVKEITKFDAEFDPFLTQWMSGQKLAAMRSSEILNWRYFGIPDRSYQVYAAKRSGSICGYMVLRRMPMNGFSTLALVDLITSDDPCASAMLKRCFDIGRKSQVDLIATAINPNSPLKGKLISKGFLRTPMSFTLVTHRPKNKLEQLDQSSFSDWQINWFDHDYV